MCYCRRLLGQRTLNDLVQFAAVEPDTATLWTIINFYSLTFRHDEIDVGTDWTFHGETPLDVFQLFNPFLALILFSSFLLMSHLRF